MGKKVACTGACTWFLERGRKLVWPLQHLCGLHSASMQQYATHQQKATGSRYLHKGLQWGTWQKGHRESQLCERYASTRR